MLGKTAISFCSAQQPEQKATDDNLACIFIPDKPQQAIWPVNYNSRKHWKEIYDRQNLQIAKFDLKNKSQNE